ncbi:MAG: SOS response-associated peptidase family protein [Ignavibacteriae bacterium]|nr:SOS response-associated peptidase family protein [Ignavibacteriota bacterium]
MCSRFENKETGFSILEKLDKDFEGNYILEDDNELKKENIAPTNMVMAVINDKDSFKIKNYFWGIQFDKVKKSPLIFNSRIETIKGKKYWTQLFYKNRCLLPATAFYEWKEINKTKIPHRIFLPGEDFFFIPSIFLKMEDYYFVSMITTQPNSFMKKIHNRMPVILQKKEGIDFLNAEPKDALDMCKILNDWIKMECEISSLIK